MQKERKISDAEINEYIEKLIDCVAVSNLEVMKNILYQLYDAGVSDGYLDGYHQGYDDAW